MHNPRESLRIVQSFRRWRFIFKEASPFVARPGPSAKAARSAVEALKQIEERNHSGEQQN
jgi:hypothetical protein